MLLRSVVALLCHLLSGASVEMLEELRNGDRLMVEGFPMKDPQPKYFGEGNAGKSARV